MPKLTAKQFNKNVPEFLHQTDEQISAEIERQAAAAPVFTYSENAVRYRRARVEEQTARHALELLDEIGEVSGDAVDFNRTKLAEAYVEQGLFKLAANTHPDARFSGFLQRIAKAKSTKKCKCLDTITFPEIRDDKRVIVTMPNFRVWRTVFDDAPDKMIAVYVCNECRQVWKDAV